MCCTCCGTAQTTGPPLCLTCLASCVRRSYRQDALTSLEASKLHADDCAEDAVLRAVKPLAQSLADRCLCLLWYMQFGSVRVDLEKNTNHVVHFSTSAQYINPRHGH